MLDPHLHLLSGAKTPKMELCYKQAHASQRGIVSLATCYALDNDADCTLDRKQ